MSFGWLSYLLTHLHPVVFIMALLTYCKYKHAGSEQNRRQKVFNRGVLRFCGWAWHSKNWQKLNRFIVFHVSIWGGLELCFGGDGTGFEQARNQTGEVPPKSFSPSLEKCVGHSLKNLGPSQKTLRPTWCSNLVTGLGKTVWWIGFFDVQSGCDCLFRDGYWRVVQKETQTEFYLLIVRPGIL